MAKRNLHKDKHLTDKVKCLACNAIEKLEYHRIIPGDTYAPENVAILCRKHHVKVHKIINSERLLHGNNIDYQDCLEKLIGIDFSFNIGMKY